MTAEEQALIPIFCGRPPFEHHWVETVDGHQRCAACKIVRFRAQPSASVEVARVVTTLKELDEAKRYDYLERTGRQCEPTFFADAAALLLRLDARVKEVEGDEPDERTQAISDRYAHFYDGKNAAKAVCDIIEHLEAMLSSISSAAEDSEDRATALEAQLKRAEEVATLAGELTKLARKEDGPFTLVSAIVWANLRDTVKAYTTLEERKG